MVCNFQIPQHCSLLEIINSKIFAVQADDVRLDAIHSAGAKLYRVEEILDEELKLSADTEAIIPVAHFHREMFTTFGVPFLFKITDVSLYAPVCVQGGVLNTCPDEFLFKDAWQST